MNRIVKDESLPALPLRHTGIATQQAIHQGPTTGIHLPSLFDRHAKINLVRAVLILSCFLVSACENSEEQIKALTEKKVMVEEGKDIESYLSQEGKVKAKLTAPFMLRYDADTIYVLFPKSLHVDFYDDSTKIETRLDSKQGKYFENLNKVYLWDSVVVINRNGDTLKSADLWWDQNSKLFYTDKYAEYRTKDRQIFPYQGLEATQDFSRITFKKPIGNVLVSDKEFPK